MKFATERLMVKGKKKFHEALPKTKFVAFKLTAKFTKVEKNNKHCTIEVNRDMLCWLLNLSVSSGMVINYSNGISTISSSITQEIFEILEEFVCKMYGFNCASVYKVRSKMFTKRLKQEKRAPDLCLLPPCQSVLKHHLQRAAYVAKLWRSSDILSIDAPKFTEFDWDFEGKLIWIDEIFPEDVKELLMLDSDAKSCDEDESNQYQRWTKVKMILKKKVTIMTLKMTKRKILTMIVKFFKIESLIKRSTM